MVHPDTHDLKEVTFHITSHEGSVVLSCMTTLELGLIQAHNNLENSIPSSVSLTSSKVDYPKKRSQKNVLVSKPKKNVCSSKEQSTTVLPAQESYVDHCVKYEEKIKTSKQEFQANVVYREDDKNCQETPNVHMLPVKPAKELNHM